MVKSKYLRLTAALIVFIMTIGISNSIIAQDIHINSNTTWSTNQNPTGNVFVENGAILTIAQGVTISMPLNSYIIVNEESKLVANDAVFGGNSWYGIYASGYGNSIDQIPFLNTGGEKQPELIFTDCRFGGMQYGINNANPITGNPNTNSGGIIRIKRCNFGANNIGIRFYKYVHMRQPNNIVAKDRSYVYNSNFEIWSGPLSPIGIYMHGVVGLRIHGCYFYSKTSVLTAIQASLSTFSVDDYYIGLPFNPLLVSESKFSNCKYGVRTSNSNALMGKVLIRNSEFVAVKNSIYALNSDNIEIYSNAIQLDKNSLRPNENVGIYLENCATFYVENNNVETFLPSISPTDYWGIVAHNCGENNNRFYRNTVSNCEYNIVGQEHNRGSVNQSGLQFICNNLSQTSAIGTDNTYYMAALTTQPNNALHGINDWQAGGAYNTTLNQFRPNSAAYNEIPQRALTSGDKYDFYNEHIRLPVDIHYKNPINKYPLSQVLESNTSNPTYGYYGDYIWVIDEMQAFSNHCPNQVPNMFPTPSTLNVISAQLQSVKIPYGPLKTIFASYENNGDYQFMLNQVNNMDNTNYTIVYYYLMNNHPSTDVIAIAVGNDIMPNYMCTDVLTTNSYGIKSQLVRDALAGRQNQLTSAQMASVKTAAQAQSQYESYLLELAALRTQINTLSTAKLNYFYNSDTVEVDMGDVINTLADNENFYSNVSLMLYYFENGDIAMAEENFNLAMNAEEVSDLETENLDILFNILLTVYNDFGGDFNQLDQRDIDQLEKLSTNESKSGGIAKSILMSEFEFEFEPILLKATQNSPRMEQIETKESNTMAEMKIMPNPASDFIGISITEDYEFPLQLNIYDISGKLVMQKQIDNLNTITLDKLTTGVYQAVITDANQKSFKQKLIIK